LRKRRCHWVWRVTHSERGVVVLIDRDAVKALLFQLDPSLNVVLISLDRDVWVKMFRPKPRQVSIFAELIQVLGICRPVKRKDLHNISPYFILYIASFRLMRSSNN